MNGSNGWIGVDLDGTLAQYHGWKGEGIIGEPVPLMLARVKALLQDGREVRIMTARVWPNSYDAEGNADVWDDFTNTANESKACREVESIQKWCVEHIGVPLPVTCMKDYCMIVLYDDRAIQIEANTGRRADGEE